MKNAKVIGLALVLLAVVVVVGTSTSARTGTQKSEQIVSIGAILPLTGEYSFIGEQMQRGIELAQDDFASKGIEVVIEDDFSFQSAAALNALTKLVKVDNVDVVITPAVNTIKTLAPALERYKVPGIVFWDSNKALDDLGDHVFSMGFSTELAGEDMAQYAHNKLGVQKVTVISHKDEWAKIISEAFAREFSRLGGSIDAHEETPTTESDYKTQIAKAKGKGSEAIYLPVLPEANNHIVRQAREQGFEGYLLGADGFVDVNVEALGDYAEGVYVTQLWTQDKELVAKYVAKYGENTHPINLAFTGIAYDAVKVVVDVASEIEKEGVVVSSSAITKTLPGYEISGVTGSSRFSEDGIATKREPIFVVRDGTFELVKKY